MLYTTSVYNLPQVFKWFWDLVIESSFQTDEDIVILEERIIIRIEISSYDKHDQSE